MSKVLEEMKTRRSIRKFKPDMIPQDILDRIIEAGTFAANGRGAQNTIIIQVTNKEIRDEIAKRNADIMGSNTDQYQIQAAIAWIEAGMSLKTSCREYLDQTTNPSCHLEYHLWRIQRKPSSVFPSCR